MPRDQRGISYRLCPVKGRLHPNGDCSPLSENFFNITSGASSTYEWDFGNNSNKGMIKVRAKAHIPVQYCGLMSL